MTEQTRVVLVTGGARGIGRGLVQFLAARDWQVAFCDVDREQGEWVQEQAGDGARYFHADVSCEEDVAGMMRAVTARHGRLDAVINNAGLAGPENGPIEELDLAVWQRRLDVNLTGPFLVSKHAVPHLRRNGGTIVNIASTRALQSEPETEAYAATKGGIVALTHALAMSLGPQIRVNCISPGWIDTRAWQDKEGEASPLSDSDHRQHPVGRVGKPEDIASLAAFLISEQAGFITGQNYVVDGGMTRKMIYED